MSENIEQEARTMGWVPQSEFRGDAEKWVSAETFVERGHTVLPILKANNRRLEEQVQKLTEEGQRLQTLFEASQEAIQGLQEVHSEHTKAAVEKAKRELKAELKQAKEDGDVDLEITVTEALAEIREQEKAAAAKPPEKKPEAPAPQVNTHPDFVPWLKENPWFGTDSRKTLRATGIAQELRADPEYDSLQGKAFFDKVVEVMEERTGSGGRPSKVNSGRPSGGPNSGGGDKSYEALPPDAKEACTRQAKKLVGEGRAYKDMASWQKYYANMYFQGEAS